MVVPNSSNTTMPPTGNTTSNNLEQQKEYVFLPVGLDVKLFLCLLRSIVCIAGFAGSLFVLRFMTGKVKRIGVYQNLNVFICSLAISDALLLINVPIAWTNFFYGSQNSAWYCKISRFLELSSPIITGYNLVVIGIERYILTCRPMSRPLSRASVVKALKGAWILAFFVTCAVISTYSEVRMDVSETHYTIVCKYDNSHVLNVAVFQTAIGASYILPLICKIFTCTCVLRSVLKRKLHPQVQEKDVALALKQWRVKKRKATTTLMAIIIAFVTPYFLFVAYATYNMLFRPRTDFTTDLIVRSVAASLAYLNGFVNFCIHLRELSGFGEYVRSSIGCAKLNRPKIHNENDHQDKFNRPKIRNENEQQDQIPGRNAQSSASYNKDQCGKKCRGASVDGIHNIDNLYLTSVRRYSI